MTRNDAARTKSVKKELLTTGIAGAAGLALLAGGTTFALWSASDTIDGATIDTGGLGVTAAEYDWYDATDAPDTVTPIADLAEFQAGPGTVVRGVSVVDIDIDGGSIDAELQVSGGALSGDEAIVTSATAYLYEGAYNGSGPLDAGTTAASAPLTGGSATLELPDLDADSPTTYSVIVVVEFNENGTPTGDGVDLGGFTVELNQVASAPVV